MGFYSKLDGSTLEGFDHGNDLFLNASSSCCAENRLGLQGENQRVNSMARNPGWKGWWLWAEAVTAEVMLRSWLSLKVDTAGTDGPDVVRSGRAHV